MEFILKLVAPDGFTARAIAQRITRLQHLGRVSMKNIDNGRPLTNF